MILGLQIIAIIFALILIYFALLHYKRNELSRDEIVFWVTIWIAVILIIIFPEFLRQLALNFFITRLFDLLVVGAFILLISMVSTLYVKTKRLENKLERIIRKDTLSKLDKRDAKDKKSS
jgi:hypothetical protein